MNFSVLFMQDSDSIPDVKWNSDLCPSNKFLTEINKSMNTRQYPFSLVYLLRFHIWSNIISAGKMQIFENRRQRWTALARL